MKPAEVSAKLRQIAKTIENSKTPKLDLVLEDLRKIMSTVYAKRGEAFLWPDGSFAAPTPEEQALMDQIDELKAKYKPLWKKSEELSEKRDKALKKLSFLEYGDPKADYGGASYDENEIAQAQAEYDRAQEEFLETYEKAQAASGEVGKLGRELARMHKENRGPRREVSPEEYAVYGGHPDDKPGGLGT